MATDPCNQACHRPEPVMFCTQVPGGAMPALQAPGDIEIKVDEPCPGCPVLGGSPLSLIIIEVPPPSG